MNIVLLSGGSGKRLWPLSNDVRSKQFIKFFDDGKGNRESMVQRMYHMIRKVDSDAKVTIATSKSQISELKNQLGEDINISMEPCRRDTFPAIVLAVSYLHDVQHVSEDESVVICPVDPYVEEDYFQALKKLSDLAQRGDSNLTLMGIEPTYPSEKYGYIIPKSKDKVAKVSLFKEKPTEEVAKAYLEQGALWNGGIFAFKISYLLNKAKEILGHSKYSWLFDNYESLPKISFDYAVVEKESSIDVMRFSGTWSDLGSWNTLTDTLGENSNVGNALLSEDCKRDHIVNELDIPVLCVGVSDVIVAASPEGVLVTSKSGSSRIKPFVDKLNTPVMFAEKSWGEYKVIDVSDNSMTIKVTLYKGHRMSYHSHQRRKEVWTVISGKGITVIDGATAEVNPGDVIIINENVKHTIIAESDALQVIEVQTGKDIDVKDKIKYSL